MEDMIDSKEIERLRYGGVHSNYKIIKQELTFIFIKLIECKRMQWNNRLINYILFLKIKYEFTTGRYEIGDRNIFIYQRFEIFTNNENIHCHQITDVSMLGKVCCLNLSHLYKFIK